MHDRIGNRTIGTALWAALAGVVIAVAATNAEASGRTILLGFVCASHESARQVALTRGWERPGTLPGDCRSLIDLGSEARLAKLTQVVEVLPLADGRWIEIGKVRRSAIDAGYSAGIAERLLLF